MNSLILRLVEPGDDIRLYLTCWRDKPGEYVSAKVQNLLRWQQRKRAWGVVALLEGEFVGFGQLTHWAERGEISDLIVVPEMRSQGIGTAIIFHLLNLAGEQKLSIVEIGVAEANVRALALYRRLGFQDQRCVNLKTDIDSEQPEPVIYLEYKLAEMIP